MSVKIKWRNDTGKTIKYIKFIAVPYNPVRDEVYCEIKRVSNMRLNCTGPYEPGQKEEAFFENVWYNNSISYCKIISVEVQFMDGTFKTIPGGQVKYEDMGGCYVDTAVYGSYDCPQVWTLRRFRDNTLGATWYGRAFIHTYYAISPTLVKWFGKCEWFRNGCKKPLDKLVARLQAEGVDDTPYQDRRW